MSGYDPETEKKRRAQYEWPWGQLSSAAYSLVDETLTVDGVTYGVEDIRRLLLERHRLATDLDRNRRHLRLRTSALVRLIARKGPVLP